MSLLCHTRVTAGSQDRNTSPVRSKPTAAAWAIQELSERAVIGILGT